MKAPPDQAAIMARCFHPTGGFVEFPEQDIDIAVSQHFERIVERCPDKLAVEIDDCSFTYSEMNRQANRIAHAILETCGDGTGSILVLGDQSPWALACFFGVMKAGKILVPVDPLFPLDRLSFMADDCQAQAILACTGTLSVAAQLSRGDRPVIDVAAIRPDISTENTGIERAPLDPARIRYTSGSTGKPKGALSNHRKDTFHCAMRINRGHICQEDRVLDLRRFGFSFTDALCGFLVGATLFPYDIKVQGLRSLADYLRRKEITYLVATPSMFRYFAQELPEDGDFPHLRLIKLGGEPTFRSDVEFFKKHFSRDCILMNQLSGSEMGPVCQYWIDEETEIDTPIVPVGYPVEGKRILLLGEDRREIAAGDVGEIAVASSYLFSGYWNQSEPASDPVLSSVGQDEHLYLSGDLGRMLPNGCLLFVGRKDDQVKIRGAKVTLREVEAVLAENPRIKQAAVVAFDGNGGDKYLVAYVVPFEAAGLTVTAINDDLRSKLANHMIPSAFVFLKELPSINGKVDRKSLPQPGDNRPALGKAYTPARNEIEKQLVRMWEEVLEVRPIGVDDDFFDLGGHSLNATRVVSRVIDHFKLDIPLQSLFESPTIADMGAVITAHRGKSLDAQKLMTLLTEVESLSDEQARQLASTRPAEPKS